MSLKDPIVCLCVRMCEWRAYPKVYNFMAYRDYTSGKNNSDVYGISTSENF